MVSEEVIKGNILQDSLGLGATANITASITARSYAKYPK